MFFPRKQTLPLLPQYRSTVHSFRVDPTDSFMADLGIWAPTESVDLPCRDDRMNRLGKSLISPGLHQPADVIPPRK